MIHPGEQLDIPNQRDNEWVGTDRSTITIYDPNQATTPQINQEAVDEANSQTYTDQSGNPVNDSSVASPVNYNTTNGSSNSGYATSTRGAQQVSYNNSGAQSGAASASYTGNQAVDRARSQLGVPYVWGGTTPGKGLDCSGLVQYAEGLSSQYRTTYQQQALGAHHYDVQNAQAGDIYFWGSDSAPYHTAVAEGNGNYIQAPRPGQNVQEGNINYYRPSYYVSMQNQ